METKTRINLSIDSGVVIGIKERGLNMSGLCEGHLREVIHTFQHQTPMSRCKHKWTWAFSTPGGLAKECVLCGKIKKVHIESHEETKAKYEI